MRLLLILMLFISTINAQDLSLKKTVAQDSVYIDLINELYGPIQVELTARDSLKGQIRVLPAMLLPSRDTIKSILTIPRSLIADTAAIDIYSYILFDAELGDPTNSIHNQNYQYALPYKKRKRVRIIQSFNGSFSHQEDYSKYSVDFGTQVGDTIYAAREGIVVKTIDHFTEHGGIEMIDAANLIIVMHNDGTFAHYLHLDYQGVLVKPGDRIYKTQAIGISGWTGFSTLPHLHFSVLNANNQSVPFYFEGYFGTVLKKGKWYRHK